MEYVFRTTTYDVESLMPEMVKALEKREEMNESARAAAKAKAPRGKTPEQLARKKQIVNAIYGSVLLVLGVYLVLVAVKDADRRVLAAIAALWSFGAAAYSILRGIRPNPNEGKRSSASFAKPARSLLTHIAKGEPTEIRFDEKGMTFAGAPTILYKEMDYLIETPSGYLVNWAGRAATFLQKKDFVAGEAESFADFVIARL